MTEEHIMAVLEDTDAGLVREALALFLAEDAQTPSLESDHLRETPEFGNFAQAIMFLKKNYAFAELDLFSTEADLVYVSTGSRRILLTDTSWEKTAGFPESNTGVQREMEGHAPAAGGVPGRFSRLEI